MQLIEEIYEMYSRKVFLFLLSNVWLIYLRKHQESLSMEDDILEIEDKKEINVQWEQKEILLMIYDINEPVREVMYLRLISNLSFAEIGAIIGKTENWTRVTFFRGKQLQMLN
ncbi:sigma-70 RNA polymerase sigma factor region 4 domain-containing protein [Diplocloster modestus]|uniref:hypothetical protein n=1 Tax=Diplocloster modestus TaxID=2850322 RepID=UPI001EE7E1AC